MNPCPSPASPSAFLREAGYGTGPPDIFYEQISSLCHASGQPPAISKTEVSPSLKSHLPNLLSEPGDKLKMQRQQITSTNYRACKYVKSILVLNSLLKSMIQMGLNLFLIKG